MIFVVSAATNLRTSRLVVVAVVAMTLPYRCGLYLDRVEPYLEQETHIGMADDALEEYSSQEQELPKVKKRRLHGACDTCRKRKSTPCYHIP